MKQSLINKKIGQPCPFIWHLTVVRIGDFIIVHTLSIELIEQGGIIVSALLFALWLYLWTAATRSMSFHGLPSSLDKTSLKGSFTHPCNVLVLWICKCTGWLTKTHKYTQYRVSKLWWKLDCHQIEPWQNFQKRVILTTFSRNVPVLWICKCTECYKMIFYS